MTHKDLSDECRRVVKLTAEGLVRYLHNDGQSLAISRQAMIDAFDKAAEEKDKG